MNVHQPLTRLTSPPSPDDMIDDGRETASSEFAIDLCRPRHPRSSMEMIGSSPVSGTTSATRARLPEVGDYVATEIARQPVFATRSKDGDVKVFFDACAHRGARLTTRRSGKASTITCRYHGWCYDTNGKCTKIHMRS